MKTTIFTAVLSFSVLTHLMAQNCSSDLDNTATELGFNPNPLPVAYAGDDYDHVNTIVLPGKVQNTIPLIPGDSINLCGVRILNVAYEPTFSDPLPANFDFNWEVWQGNTQLLINDYIEVDQVNPVTRVCMRVKVPNVPQPTNEDQDVYFYRITVRGMIGQFGNCIDVPGDAGVQTFDIQFLVNSSEVSVENVSKSDSFLYYPNPNSGIVYFQSEESNYTIKIYNSNGQLLKTVNVLNSIYQLDTSFLNTGMYIFEKVSNFNSKIYKFVKN